MAKILIMTVLSTLSIHIRTWFFGHKVGEDFLGNLYFSSPARKGYKRERRWVIYKNSVEASLVPPEYHGWLHHQTNYFPKGKTSYQQPWQKKHQPNLTGTENAYLPPGHIARGRKRHKASGDYEAWIPPN